MTLGEKIKQIRLLRGIKQKELAKKNKVADSQITSYELGFRNPKPQSLKALANALEVGTAVLTDIDMTALGDIKSLLFQLDKKIGLKLTGESLENGTLKEGSISITFESEYINTFLKEWADKRHELAKQEAHIQEASLNGNIHDLGLNHEFESYCQYDSGWIVKKGSKGMYQDFTEK